MELSDLPPIATAAAPVYLVLLAVEAWLVRRGEIRGRFEARDTATSLIMGVGSLFAGAFLSGLVVLLWSWAWQHRFFELPVGIATGFACFVLDDLRYYWVHRFDHRIRWCWASHVVHHSSREYNLGTALRQTWTGPLTGTAVLGVPMILLGFHPALIAFVHGLNLVYQFWIHTEAVRRMPGWFEAVFNTPSHHRVHHGTNPRYLDANYAGVLILWDKGFGTFVPERDDEPVRYGILHDIGTYNPLRVAFQEYIDIARDQGRAGLGLRDRLAYVLAPPGWSHDGSREMTADVKARFVSEHLECAGQPGLPHS